MLFIVFLTLLICSTNAVSLNKTLIFKNAEKPKNILVVGPLDTGTHMLSMSPFVVELSNAGHNVSIFEWNYKQEPRDLGPKVNVFHIHQNSPDATVWKKRAIQTFVGTFNSLEFVELFPIFNNIIPGLVEDHSDVIQAIMRVKWDLIVIDELFAFHGMGIASFFRKYYNVPYAIYSTSQMMSITSYELGLSRNMVARPYLITQNAGSAEELFDEKKFSNRLLNFFNAEVELLGTLLFGKYFSTNNRLVGMENFDFGKFYRGSSLTVVDYYNRWTYPITENSRLKGIASTCKKASPLTGQLKEFVEDPRSKGTIYIAFGTTVFWQHAPQKVLDAFFHAIENLNDYRVIFAYNGNPVNVSSHVKLVKFAPQFEILTHPRTKVYITHGGLKSSKEAVCAGVPVVYMPLYAEQTFNSHMATKMGYALPLNKHTVTKQSVETTIRKVVEDPQFRHNIKRAKSLAFDKPISAGEEVLFYVRRLLNSRNGKFDFDNKSNIPLFDYLHGHLILLILFLLFLVGK